MTHIYIHTYIHTYIHAIISNLRCQQIGRSNRQSQSTHQKNTNVYLRFVSQIVYLSALIVQLSPARRSSTTGQSLSPANTNVTTRSAMQAIDIAKLRISYNCMRYNSRGEDRVGRRTSTRTTAARRGGTWQVQAACNSGAAVAVLQCRCEHVGAGATAELSACVLMRDINDHKRNKNLDHCISRNK